MITFSSGSLCMYNVKVKDEPMYVYGNHFKSAIQCTYPIKRFGVQFHLVPHTGISKAILYVQ